jgi:membrane protein implicated in regulation of membrane protease activity
METFVGGTFFLLLIVGLALMIFGNRGPRIPNQFSRSQVAGLTVAGIAFLWFALLTAYFEKTSPRPTITGTIGALRQNTGRYASSEFTVVGDAEDRASIRCKYEGTGLQMGERIRVRYIQYNRQLLDAEILSGSVAGWNFSESDGTWSCVFMGSMGLLFLFGAYRASRKLPLP